MTIATEPALTFDRDGWMLCPLGHPGARRTLQRLSGQLIRCHEKGCPLSAPMSEADALLVLHCQDAAVPQKVTAPPLNSTPAPATPDPLQTFLSALFEHASGVIELRALPSQHRAFCMRGDDERVRAFLRTHAHENVYVGMATRRNSTSGKLENCHELRVLFADLDFKHIPEADARQRLREFPFPPSLIIHSGGGLHVYWLLREPLDLQTDSVQARALLRRVARVLGGDLVSAEPAHVLRLPDTMNYKYTPPRPVRLESFDGAASYHASDFDACLPEEPAADPTARFTVGDAIVDGERNSTLFKLARSLKARGLGLPAILAALQAENKMKCQPPLAAEEVEQIAQHAHTQPDRPEFVRGASASSPVNNGTASTRNGAGTENAQDLEPDEVPGPVDDLGAFPEDAWRGAFQVYREAMHGTSEAPDTAHFTALWAVAAACLRRRVSFYYAFTHYPNVYLVNFGNTGDSKTSAGRQGLRLLPDHGVKLLRGVGSAEALGDWMKQPEEGPAVSHLLFIEELATLLTRGGWEGSTLLSFLTETFDAPDRYEIPFRKNPVLVQEPTPTLIAGTTIEWLWKGLREIDVHGGFGNRIFYMTGTTKPPIPLPAKPDPDALATVRADLQRLAEHPTRELFFNPQAQALWNDFYRAWKSTTWPDLTTAAIKRVPAYIVKLAMVYACFEQTSLITAEQLEAAIKVGHYGAKCADRLMNRHRQHTVQGKCETRVLAVLADADLPAWQIHRRISGSYTAEELSRAIRALEAAGAVLTVKRTHRGEPVLGRRDRKREV